MSDVSTKSVVLPEVSKRLKTARILVGLKQIELAAAGGVSRATQLSYESGATEPTTEYLRNIQSTGIDIPFVLFGTKTRGTVTESGGWISLHMAVEGIDDFLRVHRIHAPTTLRRRLVESLYDDLLVASKDPNCHVSPNFIGHRAEKVWHSMGLPKLPIPASTVFTL